MQMLSLNNYKVVWLIITSLVRCDSLCESWKSFPDILSNTSTWSAPDDVLHWNMKRTRIAFKNEWATQALRAAGYRRRGLKKTGELKDRTN